jgi:GxxExxY protein
MSLDFHTEQLAKEVITIAMQVHSTLGPGLLESAYKECLFYEISTSGYHVEKEKPIPLIYQKVALECGYRADLIVENKILLELKAVEELNDIHLAQMLTYLRIGGFRLGFLMNFNVKFLKDGLKRVIL